MTCADPQFHDQGLMTEAAERVTEYAFKILGWPHLWLNNAEGNRATARIKEKQGAALVELEPAAFVSGPAMKMVWRLDRDAWLAHRGTSNHHRH